MKGEAKNVLIEMKIFKFFPFHSRVFKKSVSLGITRTDAAKMLRTCELYNNVGNGK